MQLATECRHGAYDRVAIRLPAEFPHERLIDLDPVERKPLQIGKRGIAGSEVIHRDADAKLMELALVQV